MEKPKSIGSLDSREVTPVLFTLRFVWGRQRIRNHCFCPEAAPVAFAVTHPGIARHFTLWALAVSRPSKSCCLHCPLQILPTLPPEGKEWLTIAPSFSHSKVTLEGYSAGT